MSTGALVTNGPLKVGWFPEQEEEPDQPTGGALTSVISVAERPKVGLPQIFRSSLVCRGPLMLSAPTKTI